MTAKYKAGWYHAINLLMKEYRRFHAKENLTAVEAEEKTSLAEGITFLCEPYREGGAENKQSPMYDPDLDILHAAPPSDDVEATRAFHSRISEHSKIAIKNRLVAQEALYFVEHGRDLNG